MVGVERWLIEERRAAAASITVKISVSSCPGKKKKKIQLFKEDQPSKSPEHLSLGPYPAQRGGVQKNNQFMSGEEYRSSRSVRQIGCTIIYLFAEAVVSIVRSWHGQSWSANHPGSAGLTWHILDFMLVRKRTLGNLLSRQSWVKLCCQRCMSANSLPLPVHIDSIWDLVTALFWMNLLQELLEDS